MFKVNQLVIYPNQGVGKINKISKIKTSGVSRDYYEIEFEYNAVSISLPIDNAVNLGLTEAPSKKVVLKSLNGLGTKLRLDKKRADIIKELDTIDIKTTDIKQIVSVINKINAYHKFSEKPLGAALSNTQDLAIQFLRNVVLTILGEKALKNYPMLIDD